MVSMYRMLAMMFSLKYGDTMLSRNISGVSPDFVRNDVAYLRLDPGAWVGNCAVWGVNPSFELEKCCAE